MGRYKYRSSGNTNNGMIRVINFQSFSRRGSLRRINITKTGKNTAMITWCVMASPAVKAKSKSQRFRRSFNHNSVKNIRAQKKRAANVYTSAITAWDQKVNEKAAINDVNTDMKRLWVNALPMR